MMIALAVILCIAALGIGIAYGRRTKAIGKPAGRGMVEMEVFSEASNFPVIRHPGRRFPGSLIQGDSLSYHYQLATSALGLARKTGNEELIEKIEELQELLELRVAMYEETFARFGMELPYPGPLVRK